MNICWSLHVVLAIVYNVRIYIFFCSANHNFPEGNFATHPFDNVEKENR